MRLALRLLRLSTAGPGGPGPASPPAPHDPATPTCPARPGTWPLIRPQQADWLATSSHEVAGVMVVPACDSLGALHPATRLLSTRVRPGLVPDPSTLGPGGTIQSHGAAALAVLLIDASLVMAPFGADSSDRRGTRAGCWGLRKAGRGRLGVEPLVEQREVFASLIAAGVNSAACRQVAVNRKTGTHHAATTDLPAPRPRRPDPHPDRAPSAARAVRPDPAARPRHRPAARSSRRPAAPGSPDRPTRRLRKRLRRCTGRPRRHTQSAPAPRGHAPGTRQAPRPDPHGAEPGPRVTCDEGAPRPLRVGSATGAHTCGLDSHTPAPACPARAQAVIVRTAGRRSPLIR